MRIGERLSGLPFSPAQQRVRKAKRTRIAQEGKEVASYVVRVNPGKSGYFATLCSASHFASARLQADVAKNDASRRTQDSPAAGMCSEDERGGVFDPGACPDRLGEVTGCEPSSGRPVIFSPPIHHSRTNYVLQRACQSSHTSRRVLIFPPQTSPEQNSVYSVIRTQFVLAPWAEGSFCSARKPFSAGFFRVQFSRSPVGTKSRKKLHTC